MFPPWLTGSLLGRETHSTSITCEETSELRVDDRQNCCWRYGAELRSFMELYTKKKMYLYSLCFFFFSNTGCDENTQTLLLWLTRSFIMINIDALMPTELVKVHRGAPTVCGSTHYSCLRHCTEHVSRLEKKKKKLPRRH